MNTLKTMTMKNILFFLFALLMLGSPVMAQQNADPSAALEVNSTTKGFLPPRMTTTQRDAITTPTVGLIIYNTSTHKINFYNGSSNSWVGLAVDAASAALEASTAVASFTYASTGNFVQDLSVFGDYQVVITNNSLSDVNLTFATSDISFSGVSGVSVSSVSPSGAQTIAPGATQTVNYVLSGNPGSAGTLTGIYAFSSLSANANITVDANPFTHNGKDYKAILSSTGKIWLDRNLGANRVATSLIDTDAYGDLYQWGRNTDGHQSTTSAPTAGPVASGSEGNNFITSGGDWLSAPGDTRWNGATKGTHDPCPTGFRVPTETELDAERMSFAMNDADGAFGSELKFPAAGYRLPGDGALLFIDSEGTYWSSTVDGTNARFLYFGSTIAGMYSFNRAYGLSVRCIKE